MPALPYLVGRPPLHLEPLARYLPPVPEGVVSAWLQANLTRRPVGTEPSWVLDPFGAAPRVAIEAARAGYHVLVAANNPISRFLLEMAAHPPNEDELRSALAELAAARKGDERLEPHIRSLYITRCDQCGKEVEVEAFLWDRGDSIGGADRTVPTGPVPFARIYHCPHCNASGEFPAIEMDLARATQFSSSSLHRARALERVAPLDDPDRVHAEEALAVYLPRAVYALFTLINRLDGMSLPPERRRYLTALLLSACDQANTLWPYPTGRARPRALTIPPKFRENNVWLALEQAMGNWITLGELVPLTNWPEKPPREGGITLFEGRLRDLVANLSDISIGAVITALPRPNQAFWTLSALWAGWLWGQEAVGPFKSVLRRRRYDWAWHTTALHAAMESLASHLKPETPFFGMVGESEPGFLSAAMIAAEHADFEQIGLAMPTEGGQAQISWSRAGRMASHPISDEDRILIIRSAAKEYMQDLGEPSHYLNLHAAALSKLAETHGLRNPEQIPADILAMINNNLEEAFSFRGGFLRFGGSEKSLEVGHWWLREIKQTIYPLADRVEVELVRYLIAHPGASLPEIYHVLCQAFQGLLTPSAELIQTCLESYGEETPPGSGIWRFQAQNAPQARRADLEKIAAQITEIGSSLGYHIEGEQPILWRNEDGQVAYAWYIIASAVIGEHIFKREQLPRKSLIALPGGRANLVAYKLQHDIRLRQAVEEGWRFVKFRQVRWLAQNPVLARDALDPLLSQDTLTYESPQMRLF